MSYNIRYYRSSDKKPDLVPEAKMLEARLFDPALNDDTLAALLTELLKNYYAEGLYALSELMGSYDLIRVAEEPQLSDFPSLPGSSKFICLIFGKRLFYTRRNNPSLVEFIIPPSRKEIASATISDPDRPLFLGEKYHLLKTFSGSDLSCFTNALGLPDPKECLLSHPLMFMALREETTIACGSKEYLWVRRDYPNLSNALGELDTIDKQRRFILALFEGNTRALDFLSEKEYFPDRHNALILSHLFDTISPLVIFEQLEILLENRAETRASAALAESVELETLAQATRASGSAAAASLETEEPLPVHGALWIGAEAFFSTPQVKKWLERTFVTPLLDSTTSVEEINRRLVQWEKTSKFLWAKLIPAHLIDLLLPFLGTTAAQEYILKINQEIDIAIRSRLLCSIQHEDSFDLLPLAVTTLLEIWKAIRRIPPPPEIPAFFEKVTSLQPELWKELFSIFYRRILHDPLRAACEQYRGAFPNTMKAFEQSLEYLYNFSYLEKNQPAFSHVLLHILFKTNGHLMLELISSQVNSLFRPSSVSHHEKICTALIMQGLQYIQTDPLEDLIRSELPMHELLGKYLQMRKALEHIVREINAGNSVVEVRSMGEWQQLSEQFEAWQASLRTQPTNSPILAQFNVYFARMQALKIQKDQLSFRAAALLQQNNFLDSLQTTLSQHEASVFQKGLNSCLIELRILAGAMHCNKLQALISELEALLSLQDEKSPNYQNARKILTAYRKKIRVLQTQLLHQLREIALPFDKILNDVRYLNKPCRQLISEENPLGVRLRAIVNLKSALRQDIAGFLIANNFSVSSTEKLAVGYIWKYTGYDTNMVIEKLIDLILKEDNGFLNRLLLLNAKKYLCLARGTAYEAPPSVASILFTNMTEEICTYFNQFSEEANNDNICFRTSELQRKLAEDGYAAKAESVFCDIQRIITQSSQAAQATTSRP